MADEYFLISDSQRLIRLSDGNYPMYMPQVRASTTQTSFPIPIRDYILEPFGYMPVYDSPYPNADVVTEGSPELHEDGKWYRVWNVRDFTEAELEQNLIDAKQILTNDAMNLLSSDISLGLNYSLNGVDYLVNVSQDRLTLLLAMKSIAKDAEDSEIFTYRFDRGEVLDLTKGQFLNMWDVVFNSIYNSNKNLWLFISQVNSVTVIEDLPELPQTFKV